MNFKFQLPARKDLFMMILLLLFSGLCLNSQDLKFNHLSTEHGLSQVSVNTIHQDKKGFLWFGTQDGLNKYDGYTFEIFKHNPVDSNSLSNNFIYCVFEDKSEILWIGTYGGGLDSYNPKTNRFRHYVNNPADPNSLCSNSVRKIFQDSKGIIWIGTEKGVNSIDPVTGKMTAYKSKPGVPGNLNGQVVFDILEDKNGLIWFATLKGGLNSFDRNTKKFTAYPVTREELQKFFPGKSIFGADSSFYLKANQARALYLSKDGVLWTGTDGAGIFLFDVKGKKFKGAFNTESYPFFPLSNNRVLTMAEDHNGMVWVGTYGGGVNHYNPKITGFISYTYDEKNPLSISNNEVRCLLKDMNGNMWAGTESGGLSVYFRSMSKFSHIQKNDKLKENTLRSNMIMAIMEDRDGMLWIGTKNGGLTTLDRKTGTYTQMDELVTSANESILSLMEDRDGDIWVGTYGGGLNVYNKTTGKARYYSREKGHISEGTIICILQDSKGTIWFGTYDGGLYALDKNEETFTNFTVNNGMTSNIIYSLYEDKKGGLWIGTDGGGVMRRDPVTGQFTAYRNDKKKNSISNNSVNCIYEDEKGNMWFGTANGLNKLDLKTNAFLQYFEKDGLANDYIYAILPDKKGKLWLSTNKAVVRFDPDIQNIEGNAFRNYSVNDGLQRGEFNQGAYHRSRSGEIFFGGVNGFNAFFPENIWDNRHIPPVYIISYKRFGKEVDLDTSITDKKYIELSYKDNFFSFEFVTLDYVMPSKNKYSYMMEGVDEDWSPPSNVRYASYTNLPGGEYIFRVRASNNDGVWNDKGAILSIRIIPPFWRTNLFYALCAIFLLAAIFGFVRFRTAAIKKENKLLEAKVEERTQELAEKNKDITSSIQYAKRIQEAILPELDHISRHISEYFILYKPKDIVSGDFYWFGEKNGRKIIAAVDCTGHGVPGALMSMIGHNLLNSIILENNITEPATILKHLNEGVQSALKQGTHEIETTDGMDVALCSIDFEKREVQFAGAYRPLFMVKNDGFVTELNIEKIEGNKFPIGGKQLGYERIYTNQTRYLSKGDTIYMFSDGYADQFGGEKGKKFMMKRFSELLVSLQPYDMKKQGKILEETIETWKGSYQQVDDILVMGIRMI